MNNISTYNNNPNHFEAVHRENKVPIINKRQRSLSVPNLGIIMPSIESPRLTKNKGWVPHFLFGPEENNYIRIQIAKIKKDAYGKRVNLNW